MIKLRIIFQSALFIFIVSCSSGSKEIATYTVSHKDFDNVIVVDGFAEPVRSTSITCPDSGSGGTIAFIIADGTLVEEGDILCTIENKEMQTYYDQLLIRFESAEAYLEKTKADLNLQYALLEAQVKNNEAETEIAHLDSIQLAFYSPTQRKIRELELEAVRIEKEKLDKKLKALAVIQQSEVKRLELEIQRFSNSIKSEKEKLDALVIKATKKGLVMRAFNPMTGLKVEVGDAVWNNFPLLSIPELDAMKVKITASERDFKYININDSVSYSFDAMPDNIAWGKVTNKIPVGQQAKEGSKVKYFEIEASIDSVHTMPDPGFTANCYIMLKQVKDTISIPQIAIFEQDSMKIVYVRQKDKFQIRQVQTGESSPKEAVIVRGLGKNEIIALSRPSESSIEGKIILPDSITHINAKK